MLFNTNKEKGMAGLSLAVAYYGSNGYVVSIPLNDTQDYDLVIEKDDIFQTVQCKATGTESNQISLRTAGCNTKGAHIYKTVIDTDVDLLFCIDRQQNLFSIPVKELKKYGNTSSLTLKTEPDIYQNKRSFPSERYIVHI